MIFFALWYTFDDWLAVQLHTPWIGEVPLLLAFAAEWLFYVALAVIGGTLNRLPNPINLLTLK